MGAHLGHAGGDGAPAWPVGRYVIDAHGVCRAAGQLVLAAHRARPRAAPHRRGRELAGAAGRPGRTPRLQQGERACIVQVGGRNGMGGWDEKGGWDGRVRPNNEGHS